MLQGRQFQQAQRNRGRSLLARRPKRAQIARAECELYVVAMRPHERQAAPYFVGTLFVKRHLVGPRIVGWRCADHMVVTGITQRHGQPFTNGRTDVRKLIAVRVTPRPSACRQYSARHRKRRLPHRDTGFVRCGEAATRAQGDTKRRVPLAQGTAILLQGR